jgi:hypothetical protein
MINDSLLASNLKLFVKPNYDWIISNGGNEKGAQKVSKELLSILNSISVLRYPDFRRYIQIRKELGENNTNLNSRIMSVRGFAKFLKNESYAVDTELLTYPTFPS